MRKRRSRRLYSRSLRDTSVFSMSDIGTLHETTRRLIEFGRKDARKALAAAVGDRLDGRSRRCRCWGVRIC